MEIPPGVSGASGGTTARAQSFCIPTTYECKKFRQIIYVLHKVGFECLHHLMVSPSLNLHAYCSKVPFRGPHHLPQYWGKKLKATTKVTLASHQLFSLLDLTVFYRLHPDGRAGGTHPTGMHSCFHCCFTLMCFSGFTPTVDCHVPNFSCDNHTKCIAPDKLCNNDFDCHDETDEGFLCGTIT